MIKKNKIAALPMIFFILGAVSCSQPSLQIPTVTFKPTISLVDSIGESLVLHAGEWSDDYTGRDSQWNSSTIAAGGTLSETSIDAGTYDLWIRVGTSSYKLVRAQEPYAFTFASNVNYSFRFYTETGTGLVWSLSDDSSSGTEYGTLLEYPDVGQRPQVDVSNGTGAAVIVYGGTWAEAYDSRAVDFYTSAIAAGADLEDYEVDAGTYNLWIRIADLVYPLLDGSDPADFVFAQDGQYELALSGTSSLTWTLTDADNPESPQSGAVGSTGFSAEAVEPPAAPTIRAPTNGTTSYRITYLLKWYAATGAETYDLYIDTTDGSTLAASDLTVLSYDYDLEYDTTYYWKVVAKNEGGSTATDVVSFTTEPPLTVSISSDEGADTNQGKIPIYVDFNMDIDEDTFTSGDITVSGSATISSFRIVDNQGRFYLNLPDASGTYTITIPAAAVSNSGDWKTNVDAAELSFQYHYFPCGNIVKIVFQADSQAAWGLDYTNARLLRYDVERGAVLNAWDLPYTNPVSMARIGNELFIVYEGNTTVSRFSINQTTPSSSALESGTFSFPVKSGHTHEETFEIAALADSSRLAVAYQDDETTPKHWVCLIYSATGSASVAPVQTGEGSITGIALDFSSNRLVVGERGTSNGNVTVFTVGASSLTTLVASTEMKAWLDNNCVFDSTGTRLAVRCGNTDIASSTSYYYMYDIGIDGGAFVANGYWNVGAHNGYPVFSPDDEYLYLRKTGSTAAEDLLTVWDADGYSLIRELSFPYGSNYARLAVSPDGTVVVGYSYSSSSTLPYHKFYSFTDIRD